MNHNPIISYEMLHFSALAFIMTCLAIPVGGMLYSWIAKRFQPERIVVPDWDFSSESDSITFLSNEDWISNEDWAMIDWAPFDRKPYDWTKEID
tara:strand:- start:14311 stop:14592 length:282 start_codon:yes stop_codon:yes gene_type:complete